MSRSKTDIWMPLYIGDYLADTADLNAEQSGCYLHWLMHYWRKGPLPDDIRALVLIGKLDSESAPTIARALLEKYFHKDSDSKWHQKRADEEKAKSDFYHDRASLGGQARAEKAARDSSGQFAPASPASHQLNGQLKSSTSPSPSQIPSESKASISSDSSDQTNTSGEESISSSKRRASKSNKASQDNFSFLNTEEESSKRSSARKEKSAKKNPDEKPPNPKHVPFREAFKRCSTKLNGKPPSWDGREGKHLDIFLEANPTIEQNDWETILDNWANSPVPHKRRLSKWIDNAMDFLDGPANKWGDPITGNQGYRKPPARQEIAKTDHAASFGFAPGQNEGKF